jgi:hypothetical protein
MRPDEDVDATLPKQIADCKVTHAARAPDETDNSYDHEITAVIRAVLLTQGPVIQTFLRGDWSTNRNLEMPSSILSAGGDR